VRGPHGVLARGTRRIDRGRSKRKRPAIWNVSGALARGHRQPVREGAGLPELLERKKQAALVVRGSMARITRIPASAGGRDTKPPLRWR